MEYLLIFKMPSDTSSETIRDMVAYSAAEKFTCSEDDDSVALYRPSGWNETKGIIGRAKSFGWALLQKV